MIKNFIVDRVVRGNMYSHKTGELLWSLNQITNPSLSMESETVDAVDALGTPIMTFDRSKSCTFSAENAIFDMQLLGQQVGQAADEGEIVIPMFELFDIDETKSITLSKTPIEEEGVSTVDYIYVLEKDGSLGDQLKVGEGFSIDGNTITITTDVPLNRVFVSYEYMGKASYVVNSANKFPTAGKFVMEVLGRDVCDATTEIYAMLVLHNAKLSASTELTFGTESTQGFELVAQQDYCSKDNLLFTLIVPEDDETV